MRRSLLVIGTAFGALLAPAAASAATYVVDAQNNSILTTPLATPGNGLATGLTVSSGQTLNIWTSASDLWASGAIPRWSNANGQIGDLFATGTDDSLAAAGTKIGEAAPFTTVDGFTAPVGALVGQIGTTYQLIGTSYSGTAWDSGELKLFFWDIYSADNTNSISVAAAVPEPATWALMMAGFGILGFGLRRRTSAGTRVSFKFA